MEVNGEEVSLTNYGRTRGSRFRPIFNWSDVPASCTDRDFSPDIDRSDLVSRRNRPRSDSNHHSETGEESLLMFLKESMSKIHSEILRTGYITANNRR